MSPPPPAELPSAPSLPALPAGPQPFGLVVVQAVGAQLPGAALRVAGLTVLERAVRQLRRQGNPVLVAAGPGALLPRPRYWPRGAELVRVPDEAAAHALAQERSATALVAGDVVRPHNRPDAPAYRVTDEPSRHSAEDAVFAELLRGDLGVVARHLNKPVSFRITRYLLCRLPFTPNQVTIFAGLVALCGAALISTGRTLAMVGGFFLAHLQSVLDGCDGELARVRFEQSAIGEWLDTIVDDALNLTLAVAIGVGLWRAYDSELFLFAGLATGALLLFYNVVAYRELVRQGEGGEVLKIKWWFAKGADIKQLHAAGKRGGLLRVVMALSRRDMFIFLWLVLALCGLAPVISLYILLVALGYFLVALIQLFHRR
jgi:phosphatidylglycerophosphate synthase